jgi:hypothetical protein
VLCPIPPSTHWILPINTASKDGALLQRVQAFPFHCDGGACDLCDLNDWPMGHVGGIVHVKGQEGLAQSIVREPWT